MDTTVIEDQERQRDADDGLRPRIQELKERILSLDDRAKGFIREHPAACLMGALGLGYLFARIARRGAR